MTAWISGVLDAASARLLAMEEAGVFPEELSVSSDVYATLTQLRQRDLSRGVPLLVLGVEVTADPDLSGDEFQLGCTEEDHSRPVAPPGTSEKFKKMAK